MQLLLTESKKLTRLLECVGKSINIKCATLHLLHYLIEATDSLSVGYILFHISYQLKILFP